MKVFLTFSCFSFLLLFFLLLIDLLLLLLYIYSRFPQIACNFFDVFSQKQAICGNYDIFGQSIFCHFWLLLVNLWSLLVTFCLFRLF